MEGSRFPRPGTLMRDLTCQRAGRDNGCASPGPPAGSIDIRMNERPALLVSACLLGVACNHEGRHSRRDAVEALAMSHRLVPVCPEVCGGLSTPRVAAELCGDRVVTADGDDVTDAYARGAATAVELARAVGARRAVLKARSPSCGSADVYDGTFTRTLRPGDGVTAAALRAAGIDVCSEDDL